MKKLLLIGAVLITLVSFTSCMTTEYATRSGGTGKYHGRTARPYNSYNSHGYNYGHGRTYYGGGVHGGYSHHR